MVQLSAFCCHGCSAATAGLDYITVLAIMPHFICFSRNHTFHMFSRNPQGQQKDLVFRPGFLAPQVGLEPTTLRLTAECSAIELLRNIGIRRRPTLPDRYQSSTIGTEGLNFCVRYGNRWNPFVIATGNGELFISTSRSPVRFRTLASRVVFRPSLMKNVRPDQSSFSSSARALRIRSHAS